MLDLKWGDEIIKKRWDSPHNLSQYLDSNGQLQFSDSLEKNWDEEESWRCWIAAVVMLNHYNGGNLTEDEVKLKVKGNKSNLKLDAFPHGRHGCGYGSDINFALKWALNLSYADIHYYHGRPSELEILSALQNGRPVIIWQLDHLMVIDAALYNDEKMYIDKNFGGTIVAPNSAVIIGQAQKVFYGTVLARDITVHQYATLFHVAFEQHLDNSFYAIDWRKK